MIDRRGWRRSSVEESYLFRFVDNVRWITEENEKKRRATTDEQRVKYNYILLSYQINVKAWWSTICPFLSFLSLSSWRREANLLLTSMHFPYRPWSIVNLINIRIYNGTSFAVLLFSILLLNREQHLTFFLAVFLINSVLANSVHSSLQSFPRRGQCYSLGFTHRSMKKANDSM